MRFARQRISRHHGRALAAAMQNFAAPRNSNADQRKSGAVDHEQRRKARAFVNDEKGGGQAQCRCKEAGAQAADRSRDENRRHEIEKNSVIVQDRSE